MGSFLFLVIKCLQFLYIELEHLFFKYCPSNFCPLKKSYFSSHILVVYNTVVYVYKLVIRWCHHGVGVGANIYFANSSNLNSPVLALSVGDGGGGVESPAGHYSMDPVVVAGVMVVVPVRPS